MTRGAAWVLGLALGLAASGCIHHRGGFAPAAPEPLGPARGMLVVLGESGRPGPIARTTADHLERVLAQANARGLTPVVLWLGDATGVRPWRPNARPRCFAVAPGDNPFARAVAGHRARVVAVSGATEANCPKAPTPWPVGALQHHDVLRLDPAGVLTSLARCESGRCVLAHPDSWPDPASAVVDLVVLDLWPWLHPEQVSNAQLRVDGVLSLLHALATGPSEPVPRVLVLHMPVEGGLEHGQGALAGPDATFHLLPEPLQHALLAGAFVGVIAGGEHGQYVVGDLSPILARTDKRWPVAPIWQVVSGTSSDPNARAGAALRRSAWVRGIGYIPEVWTDHPGFAAITFGRRDSATVHLFARRRRRWEDATRTVELAPAPAPTARQVPSMAPCVDCPELPAPERP